MKFDWNEKYQLLIDDEEFINQFDQFIGDLISEIRNSERIVIKVDERIYGFIEDYISEKRKKRINNILRKKDT